MNYVMACRCGHEQPGRRDEQTLGAVYRCHGCQQVWAAVIARHGRKCWVPVAEDEVEFLRLMDEPEPEEV